jgi:hypothetical protein
MFVLCSCGATNRVDEQSLSKGWKPKCGKCKAPLDCAIKDAPSARSAATDIVREKLCQVVARYGRGICDDHRRCEAVLRDVCADQKREVWALVSVVREGVGAELLGSDSSIPAELRVSRVTKRILENVGLAEDLARWAVGSWAIALGAIKADELQDILPSDLPQNARTDPHLKAHDDAVEKLFRDIGLVAPGKDGENRWFPVPLIWADEQGAVAYVLKEITGGVVNRVRLPLLAMHSPRIAPDTSRVSPSGSTACRIEYTLFAWTLVEEDMTQIVQGIFGKFGESRKVRLQGVGIGAGSELVLQVVANNRESGSQGRIRVHKYRFDLSFNAWLPR